MPFFAALGYDVFNPREFVPEFTADVGKKGERVDYAVVIDKKPAILVECKPIAENLHKYWGQLFKYFIATQAKFGVLTDGCQVLFYTDIDEPNKMDKQPFLSFDVTNIKEGQIKEIAKFHKDNFDVDKITSSASELKYLIAIKEFLASNLTNPTEEFTKLIMSNVYEGVRNQKAIEKFKPIISKSFSQVISEKVNEKLNAALNTTEEIKTDDSTSDNTKVDNSEIVTTSEELEAYTVFCVVAKDVINPDRIVYRDAKAYFGILLDDNNRKWVFRFYQKATKNLIEIRDAGKFEIDTPLDITKYADKIKSAIEKYQ